MSAKYGKNVVGRYSIQQSKIIYQEMAETLADVTSKQGARRWANSMGFSPRYTPQVLNRLLEKNLFDAGLATVNTYDNVVEINKRHQLTNSIPARTIIKDTIVNGAVGRSIPDSLVPVSPVHTTLIFQQFRP